MIEIEDLVVRYDEAVVLDRVSLTVGAGELVALIGPTGAGKSTLCNTLSGILRPYSGTVRVTGRLARVPEGRQLFGDLTVDDNLRLGGWRIRNRDTGPVYAMLPALAAMRHRPAGLLSDGERQMVVVGRALMRRPEVLVVDELSVGLAPSEIADLVGSLRELNAARGLTMLLIEQNTQLALELCSRAYVMEAGRIVAEGPAADLSECPAVAAGYPSAGQ